MICTLILFSGQVGAQSQITLKGIVIDKETNEPLPFATVTILQFKTSVVSNESGEFLYHFPQSFENGVVQISYIGYKTIKLNASAIKPGVLTTFRMEPQVQQLQEIEVTGNKGKTQAVEMVEKAIRNIRKNYPKDKTLYFGYYRDYISPAWTKSYKNLMEAALVMEDRGFQSNDLQRTKIKLEQLRYHPGIATDSSLNSAYDGKNKFIPNASFAAANELAVLKAHDPLRNHKIRTFSYVDIFDLNFTSNHKFYYESITEEDSIIIYCIRFEKHSWDYSNTSEYKVEGHIYIRSESYAILKLNYTITCNTPTYTGKFLDLKLEYKNYNDKYYLNYLSLMNYFVFKNDSSESHVNMPFFQYRELFINKIETEPFKSLQSTEIIDKKASLLTNKVPVRDGFWDSYNYISLLNLLE